MYRFMILFSRQGKVRLQKWFHAIADKDRKKICRDIVNIVSSKLYSNKGPSNRVSKKKFFFALSRLGYSEGCRIRW